MPEGSQSDKLMWREVAHHVYRLFKRVAGDSRPRLILSKNLYFRIFPDKAVLVSLVGMDVINISLSLDALRTILSSIQVASSSRQIQTVNVEGWTITSDGRPRMRSRLNPLSWLWKLDRAASAGGAPIDYIQIDIKRRLAHIREYIPRSRLELACAEFANLDVLVHSQRG